ncbi:hypothetical protein ACQKEN_13050, partial [Pseudomonas sp. NPDC078416]
ARLPAKALFLTIEMRRLYRPVRGQARSYAFGRSGFDVASAADLSEQILMRRSSRGQTWMWHPPQTCRSALAREDFGSDDRDVLAVPASSRASALLRLRQKRVRRSLGGGPQRVNLDAGLFSRADVDLASAAKPVGARLPANALVRTIEIRRLHPPLRGQARSYAFGRSGFGAASAADLNQQISMRGYSRGQTWMWHPPQNL